LIRANAGSSSKRWRVARNEHGRYCVPLASRHRPAADTILYGGVWEPDTINFLVENCADGDIVHAGAYFGDFLPALSRACTGTIWSFEPNPENYECAVETARLNGLRNVELMNAALGERSGEVTILTRDDEGLSLGGASRIVEERDRDKGGSLLGEIVVRAATVDEVVSADRRVSIIHLDVEGFEAVALRGAILTVRRWRPFLVLESLPDDAWFVENVLDLGYRVEGTVDENTILRIA
jgi:FkbM family methyltransferase